MMNPSFDLYVDFATNVSNPFSLHPSENPAIDLVSPPLEGDCNFQSWIRSMRLALMSKNKIVFVDGMIMIPSKSDALFNQWNRCNSIVLAWIQHSVS